MFTLQLNNDGMWLKEFLYGKVNSVRNYFMLAFAFMFVFFFYHSMAAESNTPASENPYGDWMKWVNLTLLALVGYFLREGITALKGLVREVITLNLTSAENKIEIKNIGEDVHDIKEELQDHDERVRKIENKVL